MRTFVVSGNYEVGGVQPGGKISEEQLGMANIDALIQAGHITLLVASKKAVESAESNEEHQ